MKKQNEKTTLHHYYIILKNVFLWFLIPKMNKKNGVIGITKISMMSCKRAENDAQSLLQTD